MEAVPKYKVNLRRAIFCIESSKYEARKQFNYYWGQDEFSMGSYALYGPGQWFGLRPTLCKRFLHTHLAGEHLADWQGFMQGAIDIGEEAASKII